MHQTLATLIATAFLSTALWPGACAQTADAQLFVTNSSDLPGPVNIYLDGVLFASHMDSGDTSVFARNITTGRHRVVVTLSDQVPGADDILNTMVDVPAGGSTLTLANREGSSLGAYDPTSYELDVSGAPACDDDAGTICG